MIFKRNKNELYRLIEVSGLVVTDFRAIEDQDYFTICFRESPLKFSVSQTGQTFTVMFTTNVPRFPATKFNAIPWTHVLVYLDNWLENSVMDYLDEQSAPDLWLQVELPESKDFQSISTEPDEEPFTEAEKEQIRISLKQFQLAIEREFKLTREEISTLNGRFDFLDSSLDGFRKTDWRSLFWGTVFNIIVVLHLDRSQGTHLWSLAKRAFETLMLP